MADSIEDNDYKIREFDAFLKKILLQYKVLRKQLKGLILTKQTQMES